MTDLTTIDTDLSGIAGGHNEVASRQLAASLSKNPVYERDMLDEDLRKAVLNYADAIRRGRSINYPFIQDTIFNLEAILEA